MVKWNYSQNSTRSVSRLFYPRSCSMDSSLPPGTNCTPEKWQKILWYKFLLLLPIFVVCGNQSWLSKISKYYIACQLCNSSRSSAGRPEWLRFKLHLDPQFPPRAELPILNGHSTWRAEFAGERRSLRSAAAGVRCRGRALKEGANMSKHRTLDTNLDSVCLVTDPTGFMFLESRNLHGTLKWGACWTLELQLMHFQKRHTGSWRPRQTQTHNPVKKGKTFYVPQNTTSTVLYSFFSKWQRNKYKQRMRKCLFK